MKRRLRKKLGLGEFQAFYFDAEMRVDKTQIDDDNFIDNWIDEIEAHNMFCVGGGGVATGNWEFTVVCYANLEGSREKRERIAAWLQATAGIEEFTLSTVYADLTRAFHSSPQAVTRQKKTNRQQGIESEIWPV